MLVYESELNNILCKEFSSQIKILHSKVKKNHIIQVQDLHKLAVGESVAATGDIIGDFEGPIVGLIDVGGAGGDLDEVPVG